MSRAALLALALLVAPAAEAAAIRIAPMAGTGANLAIELRLHPWDAFEPLAHGSAMTEVDVDQGPRSGTRERLEVGRDRAHLPLPPLGPGLRR